ncbi:hypothetical protein ACWGH4_00050 [Streptomyces sp. NPDC054847]
MTDRAYIAQLVAQLELAAEFRIPCPGHHYGHHADLHVRRRLDGRADGWAVLSDDDTHAWTGTTWVPLGSLARSEIYRYEQQDALAEAQRIAPLETQTFNTTIARLRDEYEKQHTP